MWMDKTKINSKTQTLTSEKVQEMTGKSIENFENHWINNATCYHLAAKFNPKGLHLLLTKLKDASQDRFNELYEKGTVSPLHVAALNSTSVSLR